MAAAYSGEAARLKRVAVDLTPLLPGGDNGGAKPLAIELVRRLAAMSETQGRPCEFVLLTSEKSDGELAVLDAPNVRRLCVSRPHNAPTLPRRRTLRVRATLRALLARGARRALPQKLARRIGEWYARTPEGSPPSTPLLRAVAADLLFCPFTGALFFDPAVPVVSLVHDLQYLYYPEFFDPADRHERDRHFRQVCRVASRLICVSEYTRASVLEHSGLSPERVVAIPSAPHKRLPAPAPRTVERVLSGLRLVPGRYLLYPANFWRHKNHELLLTAFGIYRAAHSQSDLKLVLTGSPSPRREELMEATRRMGLSAWVVFAGYLPDEDFAALLAGSAALLFPSLFEGFGMPVLEAMAAGVPVACGNLTSLPEIAGPPGRPAALLFDPRRPAGIAAAIERLESDPALRAGLIERGRRRAADFLTPEEWAARYFAVFQEAAGHPVDPVERPSAVYGVFPDAWTGGRITVVYGQGPTPRRLTVTLRAPEWLPSARVAIRVGGQGGQVHRIPRGQRKTITLDLPGQAGVVELLCSPTFQPGGEDLRQLGCLLESAAIGAPGETDPRQLPREAHAA
jgi:glycosyltransferase involved in cell wall biosynthesis